MLAEDGAEIDATDVSGCTSLWLASSEGHAGIAAFLLAKNANANIPPPATARRRRYASVHTHTW